ncbi:carboxypeptidase regulatory-like domain-containing protein [Cellulomonas sp. McL0617]|uniref:carboxypeptidase regulatory-like domain-containing protein n=1 Tax=Cellulomonas sp. McL0617 TaxID=3415675 RepID=UPI003CEFFBB3
MRVSSTVERLDVPPGGSGIVPLQVINTSAVIESLSVSVIGLPDDLFRSEPTALALFPEASGALTMTLALPDAFPAGTYPVTLVVSGSAPGARDAFHDLDLVVPPHPHLALSATPSRVRTRGRAAFVVEVRNDGNVPLDVALRALDSDRTLRTTLTPSTLSVVPGAVTSSTVLVRGPRQLLGSDRDRPLKVAAQATDTQSEVDLVLRQRSTISRGLLTALILLSILALWALAFLLGMKQVFGTDPFTKVAPPSFFAATVSEDGTTGTPENPNPAPAGALQKTDGPVPAGVGATITGVITGASDGQGVGRITVDAMRNSPKGLVVVSSAATQDDGSYSMAGVFPGSYMIRVSADGYETAFYGGTPTSDGAAFVAAPAQQVKSGVNMPITGLPATISGHVDTGEAPGVVAVTVQARPAWDGADPNTFYPAAPLPIDASGSYVLSNLPAPGTYELTFLAPGYQPTTITERVLGGQNRFALDVRLGAGTGQIGGLVTDGRNPLGGVQVSTTSAGKTLVVGTPTVGQVGQFVLPNLPTPATYVLTFTKQGFSTRTVVVDLTAGQIRGDLNIVMSGGAGVVTGTALDSSGAGLGGVTVTAGGSATTLSTTTLTSGAVGTFTLTGLQPGSITLTFTKPGYTSASVPVTLSASGPTAPVTVTLSSALGSVTGQVTQGGVGVAGATVQATDGVITRTTTSTAGGAHGAGTYLLADLPAGTYTLSVTTTTGGPVVATAVVTIPPGGVASQDLPIGGP